jgi:HTH-type transcriptional regulator/antitoxin HigA
MNTELTHSDYEILVMMLDDLIDVVGQNENHILVSLMDLISEFIETYEDKHVPELTEDIAVL